MNTLTVGIHLVPLVITGNPGPRLLARELETVDAELLDIGTRFCRIRIRRYRFHVDPNEIGVQFAWTDMVARVIWTNTTGDFIEMGLMLPSETDPE